MEAKNSDLTLDQRLGYVLHVVVGFAADEYDQEDHDSEWSPYYFLPMRDLAEPLIDQKITIPNLTPQQKEMCRVAVMDFRRRFVNEAKRVELADNLAQALGIV